MKVNVLALVLGGVFAVSGAAWADETADIQAEISEYEKTRDDAQAEIRKLRIQLEKATNAVNQNETKVQELQTKLDAKKN